MPPTPRAVKTEIENFLAFLLTREIALFINPVVDDNGRITWRSLGRSGLLSNQGASHSLLEYRHWLDSQSYSAMLSDGSLLQITYDFDDRGLIGHRLAYVPCPFRMDPELLRDESPVDLLDIYSADASETVLLMSTLRFDFDAAAGSSEHPATHLTVNASHCRIACAAPLRLGQFVDFVFRHFYPEIWSDNPYLDRLGRGALVPRTVTELEAQRIHVSWSTS